MKRLLMALCATLPVLSPAACTEGYGYGYGGGVYAGGGYGYDGYYDDYYGPIYDGYWGDNNAFYYRVNPHERHFRQGDSAHFSRSQPSGSNFRSMHGSVTPGHDMHMPHFRGHPSHPPE